MGRVRGEEQEGEMNGKREMSGKGWESVKGEVEWEESEVNRKGER